MSSKKQSKAKVGEMIAAVVSGASYNFAVESMAKRMDFIAENYMTIKALGAGVVGSALVYFGKTPNTKASGYGLLGVAGAAGASKIATMVVQSGNPMNGKTIAQTLNNVNTGLNAKKKYTMPLAAGVGTAFNKPAMSPYAALAFSDAIFPAA